MKDKLIIVGAGVFGKVVLEHAMKDYECAFVDDGIEVGKRVCGCDIIGKTTDVQRLHSTYKKLIVAIGNNRVREKIYKEASELSYIFPNIISESAYISPFAVIGNGCIILNNAIVQNGAVVGNGVILNPGVEVHHESKIGNNVLIYTNSVIRTYAKVGDRALIGSTLTIGNEVELLDDAVVPDGRTIVKVEAKI